MNLPLHGDFEEKVDACPKGMASSTVKTPASMRVKGYTETDANNRALQIQVHRKVKIKRDQSLKIVLLSLPSFL